MNFIKVVAEKTGAGSQPTEAIYLNIDLIAYVMKHSATKAKIIIKSGMDIPNHKITDVYADIANLDLDELGLVGLLL